MKTAKIGLLGFGNVGGGTYKILTDNKQIIEKRTGISPEIVKILQRNKKKKRFVDIVHCNFSFKLFGSILPVFLLSFTSNTRRISIAFNKMLNAIPCQTVGICCIHVGTYVDNVDHETGEKYTKYGHAKSVT